MSYWSRTVLVPLLVLMALRPRARNPRGVTIARAVRRAAGRGARLDQRVRPLAGRDAFGMLDRRAARRPSRFSRRDPRTRAIDKAVAFVTERLNGEDGLGAHLSGDGQRGDDVRLPGLSPGSIRASSSPRRRCEAARCSTPSRAYCQPCLSPVWDTGLACHALMEAGGAGVRRAGAARPRLAGRAAGARRRRRLGGAAAGPAARRLGLPVRQPALPRSRRHRCRRAGARPLRPRRATAPAIDRAAEWVIGMQSRNGGWGAFDADNTHYYLNHIPFADHGALLDPPTADVSGALPRLPGAARHARSTRRSPPALDYLRREQEADGSWFGRWGTNYIYGTWSVLCALNAAGVDHGDADDPPRRRLAARASARRWRLGRGRRFLLAGAAARRRRRTARRRRPPGRCSA